MDAKIFLVALVSFLVFGAVTQNCPVGMIENPSPDSQHSSLCIWGCDYFLKNNCTVSSSHDGLEFCVVNRGGNWLTKKKICNDCNGLVGFV